MMSMAYLVIAVEGVSDRVVLELLARRRGRDLAAEGIEIVPIGGAHAISRFVAELPGRMAVRGLCDANEEYLFRRVLDDVYVCAPDLEGELLRALGVETVQAVVTDTGDLRSFRKFQHQPAQRGRPLEPQLDRWLRSSWRRTSATCRSWSRRSTSIGFRSRSTRSSRDPKGVTSRSPEGARQAKEIVVA